MPQDGSIATAAALRAAVGEPMEISAQKVLDRLDAHCRRFIQTSPFLCLATVSADGRADVSPRGDAPGFVNIVDDRTLLIPDRPGNRRADSMTNVVETGIAGLIFFIPGVDETLRINGRGTVIDDVAALAPLAVNGRAPKFGIRVTVAEAFLHCGKALKRSRLWDPASRIERRSFPTLGQMIVDQVAPPGMTVAEADCLVEEDYRDTLY